MQVDRTSDTHGERERAGTGACPQFIILSRPWTCLCMHRTQYMYAPYAGQTDTGGAGYCCPAAPRPPVYLLPSTYSQVLMFVGLQRHYVMMKAWGAAACATIHTRPKLATTGFEPAPLAGQAFLKAYRPFPKACAITTLPRHPGGPEYELQDRETTYIELLPARSTTSGVPMY
eukprot:scaffold4908_cov109-Isochrysis_galbana.AAC.5